MSLPNNSKYPPFVCPYCGEAFSREYWRMVHVRRAHGVKREPLDEDDMRMTTRGLGEYETRHYL